MVVECACDGCRIQTETVRKYRVICPPPTEPKKSNWTQLNTCKRDVVENRSNWCFWIVEKVSPWSYLLLLPCDVCEIVRFYRTDQYWKCGYTCGGFDVSMHFRNGGLVCISKILTYNSMTLSYNHVYCCWTGCIVWWSKMQSKRIGTDCD